MATNAVVRARIDQKTKDKASAVLEKQGITVSEALRIMLTRTAKEGTLPFDISGKDEDHDAWFRAKVLEALNDPRPAIPDADVKAHFAKRRAEARRKAS